MADVTVDIKTETVTATITVIYRLYLPDGVVWDYSDLYEDATPSSTGGGVWPNFCSGNSHIYIPIDLITAARLRLIKPGDNSGLGEEQWAWIRLLGLTGEKA